MAAAARKAAADPLKGSILEVVPEQEASRFATPESVREFADKLKTTFLECRDFGHRWQPFRVDADGGAWIRIFRCSRCKTERTQKLNARGAIMANQYEYPDGYQSTGLGRIDNDGRNAIRLATISRVFSRGGGQ